MHQPWLAKALAFQLLRFLPRGVHEFLSARVTQRGERVVSQYLEFARRHADCLADYIDPTSGQIVEFGGGRDLFNALYLARHGFARQIVVDIEPLANPKSLNTTLAQSPFTGMRAAFTKDFVRELKALGIDYRAPFDMRANSLPTASVAAVISTSTLEHIAVPDIVAILRECRRILRPGGICSFFVDYSDHYSHTDRTICPYNFLRYTASTWRWLSPPNHFQNRLRHRDYCKLYEAQGFRVEVAEPVRAARWREDLSTLRMSPPFSMDDLEELSWTSGWFLLRKAAPG